MVVDDTGTVDGNLRRVERIGEQGLDSWTPMGLAGGGLAGGG